MIDSRVVFITGVSSGIGRACAERLAARGHTVIGMVRSNGATASPPYRIVHGDVTDDAAVNDVVATILAELGRIDVLINNAGIGYAGAVEETSVEEARLQLETNLFGALRVCRAVLPSMRARRSGLIVNISSIAGRVAVPFQGLYCASKFALEGLSEAMRLELWQFGIRVVLVEPGDCRTAFTRNRRTVSAAGRGTPYDAGLRQALDVMEAEEAGGAQPDAIARLVERVIDAGVPRMRYTAGPAMQRLAPAIRAVLPHRMYEYLMRRHYHLSA